MSQACDIYGVTRRTLTRWVKEGKVESKLENRRRFILITDEGHGETQEGHDDSDMSQDMSQQKLIDQLCSEVAYLRTELKETKERSDTIILQLTRQLEQSQRLLEFHQDKSPWWKRVFNRNKEEREI